MQKQVAPALTVSFGSAGGGSRHLRNGWSLPEADLVWSDGPRARLTFPHPGSGDVEFELELRPFVYPPHMPAQPVVVEVQGSVVAHALLEREGFFRFTVPAHLARSTLVLDVHLPGCRSPREFDLSKDVRKLAVALKRASLKAAGTAGLVRTPVVEDSRIRLVFPDAAPVVDGVPATGAGRVGWLTASPLVKYAEYSAMRRHFAYATLDDIGDRPAFMPLGCFGPPKTWLGLDGETPLADQLDWLPGVFETHRGLRLLMDHSWEGGFGSEFFPQLDETVGRLRIDPARVVVLLSNEGAEARYQQHRRSVDGTGRSGPAYTVLAEEMFLAYSATEAGHRRWFGRGDSLPSEAEIEAMRNVRRKWKLLSYNRRPRWHRFMLALMLTRLGLRSQALASMPSSAFSGDFSADYDLQYLEIILERALPPELSGELCELKEETFGSLPWIIDANMDETGIAHGFVFENQDRAPYLNSYLNVVTESSMASAFPGDIQISEKTCKAIVGLQPFLLFGHPGSLEALDRLGFERYLHLDSGYDSMENLGERLVALHAELARVAAWSMDDAHDFYYDNLPRTVHNRHTLMRTPEVIGDALVAKLRRALG